MFGFEPVDNTGWQPDGWNLPLEETRDGPDVYSGGVDPDLLPPSDEGVYVPQSTDIAAELTVTENSNKRSADPEVVRAVIRDQCLQGIDECLTIAQEGGPAGSRIFSDETGNFTKEGKLLRDMICEAVLDDDAAAVAAHTERLKALPSYTTLEILVEAQFAAAVLGDADAADVVHVALKDEQNSNWAKKQHIIEMRMLEPSDLDKSQRPSIHSTIIKRCVDYGIPADHWINTYAVDIEDQWGKTTDFLRYRMEMAGPDTDTVDMQRMVDEHTERLVELPRDFSFHLLPGALAYTSDPVVRGRLVDHFMAEARETPLSLDSYSSMMHVMRVVFEDPLLATDTRRDFFEAIYYQGTLELAKRHPRFHDKIIDAFYPVAETLMHDQGGPGKIVTNVNQLASRTLEAFGGRVSSFEETAVVQARERRLDSSVRRYVLSGNFEAARQIIAAMTPGNGQIAATKWCMEKAVEPAHLDALQVDYMILATEPELNANYEVAALRIEGNITELITRAIEHARAIVELRMPNAMSDAAVGDVIFNNQMRTEYVQAAYQAVKTTDASQLPVLAKKLLPVLRDMRMPLGVMNPLSEALIASGDINEPVHALEYINQMFQAGTRSGDHNDREDCMEAFWNLAKILRRTNRVQ
jgi:hypothetical protein